MILKVSQQNLLLSYKLDTTLKLKMESQEKKWSIIEIRITIKSHLIRKAIKDNELVRY